MPVIIPDTLPATHVLRSENILVITDTASKRQDVRPLKIAILNIMPIKIVTETQWLRLLSGTALQVEITLLRTATHEGRHTTLEHLQAFYKTFAEVRDEHFDCLIITGAPVEHIPFEEVSYWPELVKILEWSTHHVYSTLHVCWGAHAGLYYHHGIHKRDFVQKLSGVFRHHAITPSSLLHGFDDTFLVPHSRYSYIEAEDVLKNNNLEVVAQSPEAGVHLITSRDCRQIFMLGHPEYDRLTLKHEYDRDRLTDGSLPQHYFPNDDSTALPSFSWSAHGKLFAMNWLHHVYQEIPFDVSHIKPIAW